MFFLELLEVLKIVIIKVDNRKKMWAMYKENTQACAV